MSEDKEFNALARAAWEMVEGEEICSVYCAGYPLCVEEGGNCTFPEKTPCGCGDICGTKKCECLDK